ncbi:hypothetical protein F511_05501 [Dorcoceras hygrometricum]|uniref:Uncharacterized protein n=1 Tax=Dorcoceras hygrometricum TaxID=472368 RepID=A0A2Z7BBK7_9LAMI|nr:hypothetical protein F511_05501 [Dorcoceras hygrometricum]
MYDYEVLLSGEWRRLDLTPNDVPVASYSGSSRRLQRVATSRQRIQSRATVYPVANYSAIAYPVDMESRRRKSRRSEELQPGAKNPVVKENRRSD